MKQIFALFCLVALPDMGHLNPEKQAIKQVILDAYIEGRHRMRDAAAMKDGFDESFIMFIKGPERASQLDVNTWSTQVESTRYHHTRSSAQVTCDFPMISIAERTAVARIELRRDGRRVFTDFFSLYKMGGRWKIVGKVYEAY